MPESDRSLFGAPLKSTKFGFKGLPGEGILITLTLDFLISNGI